MRIIGIDPGTGILGFGVIDAEGQSRVMVDAGVITTKPHQALDERLLEIYESIQEIIKDTKPEMMVIEKLFFAQNVTTAISVSHARGVVMLAGKQAGMPILELTPLQIKHSITGYGRATKNQIQEMVKTMLKLSEIPKPDDCADALAAALCFQDGKGGTLSI
jgi:crossover junction endodeoxyribonuclease RuvC